MRAELETELLRCSRCGLCLSVCPTHQERGREGFSPRGRIALIQSAESDAPLAREYLESCWRCGLCETVCPTGVNYSRLIRSWLADHAPLELDRWSARLEELLELLAAERGALAWFTGIARGLGLPAQERLGAACRAAGLTSVAGAPAAPWAEGAGPPVLLLLGPVVPAFLPRLAARAVRWLSALGHRVQLAPELDTAGLSLLEHGLGAAQQAAREQLARTLERAGPFETIACLDPALPAALRPLLGEGGPAVKHLWELLEPAGGPLRANGPLIADRSPVSLDAARALGVALRLEPLAALPDELLAAGAVPIAEATVLESQRRLVERKRAWLDAAGGRLLTADPLALIRHPRAVHFLELEPAA